MRKSTIIASAILLGVAVALIWLARGADEAQERAAPEPAAPVSGAQNTAPETDASTVARPEPSVSAAPVPPAAKRPAAAAPPSEASLMVRLRSVKDRDPAKAVELAREGNRLYPNSPGAPERASILIHALSAMGRSSEARGEAENMVNRYPDSEIVREIERFTGAHRHRNLRVNDAGQLESY